MDLNQIREEIDNVDRQMVELFQKRMKLAGEVAEYKRGTGKAVYDRKREQEKLARLGAMAESAFNQHSIEELFTQIMSISRRYQYKLLGDKDAYIESEYTAVDRLELKPGNRVVYQGVPGAFSEQAMLRFFGEEVENFHVERFEDVIQALEEGSAEYGVLPIENSSAGFVSGVYHLLQEHEVTIAGSVDLAVSQALLAVPGATLADIRTVYSHPQGLLQTKPYLDAHGWEQIPLANTAVSASKVHEEQDKTQAAVASMRAAKLYGLEVLEPAINTQKNNTTRFVVISKRRIYTKKANRISISFSLPHESGSLYNVLGNFIFNGLNMTGIESEPLPDRRWEYRFFITFEGNLGDSDVRNAITSLRSEAGDFKILGNYYIEDTEE